MSVYRATTVYLTDSQLQWLRQVSGQAQIDGLALSHADVVRLALTRLRRQLNDAELREALVKHVQEEAQQYPGRVKRGMPISSTG